MSGCSTLAVGATSKSPSQGRRGRRPYATALSFAIAMVVGSTSPTLSFACSVCYGSAEGSMIDGLKLSVIALLGVTYFVVGGLAALFIISRRRARRLHNVSHQGAY